MTKETYDLIENYMLSCMEDSAHDKEHIYRVLFNALEIAKAENDIDYDVLITACLLHDIGRREQFDNPALCHAIDGSSLVIKSKKERGRALRFLFLFWHILHNLIQCNAMSPSVAFVKLLNFWGSLLLWA